MRWRLPKVRFAIDWPNHLIGFFSALFGILIAFELDQWREQRKEAELAASAFDKMKQEISINKNSLHESIQLNLQLLEVLEETVLPQIDERFFFRGTNQDAEKYNAQEAFARVAHIDETQGALMESPSTSALVILCSPSYTPRPGSRPKPRVPSTSCPMKKCCRFPRCIMRSG